jgi:alpha-L-arabinofuranosidase
VTLFCVNRNLNQDLEADIVIDGFAPTGQAQVQELFASSLYIRNDEMRPRAVRPIESTVATSGDRLHFTFRHASVTRIDLSGK